MIDRCVKDRYVLTSSISHVLAVIDGCSQKSVGECEALRQAAQPCDKTRQPSMAKTSPQVGTPCLQRVSHHDANLLLPNCNLDSAPVGFASQGEFLFLFGYPRFSRLMFVPYINIFGSFYFWLP